MSTSVAPEAIAQLHALLEGADWPERKPQVTLGVTKDLAREVVLLGDWESEQEWAPFGQRRRDEDATLEIFVLVAWPGYSALEAMRRAFALFAVIESLLRDPDHIATGREAGVLWNEIRNPRGRATVEDDGYGYVVQSGVRFRARI